MSELAKITAHYFGVLLERAGMSASVPDMRAELEAAAEADEKAAARPTPAPDTKIDRLVEASREETERGRAARRKP